MIKFQISNPLIITDSNDKFTMMRSKTIVKKLQKATRKLMNKTIIPEETELKSENDEIFLKVTEESTQKLNLLIDFENSGTLNVSAERNEKEIDPSPISRLNHSAIPMEKSPLSPNDKNFIMSLLEGDYVELDSITFKDFKEKVKNSEDFMEKVLKIGSSSVMALTHFLNRCKVKMRENYSELFDEELALVTNKYLENDRNSKITWEQFCISAINWFKAIKFPSKLRINLLKSLKKYHKIRLETISNDEKECIDSLLDKLKYQIKTLNKSPKMLKKPRKNIEENAQYAISEIFAFYSKQQFLLGRFPTFEEIHKNLEILTLSKYLMFCKDFELIQHSSNPKTSGTSLQVFQEIFKKHSDYVREMHLYQFSQSLSDIAEVYFTEEYDEKYHENNVKLPDPQKLKRLYEVLGLYDPEIYTKKLNGGLSHFGTNPSRISPNDLSKKYKFRAKKHHDSVTYVVKPKYNKKKSVPVLKKTIKAYENLKITVVTNSRFLSTLKDVNKEDFDLNGVIEEKSSDDEIYSALKIGNYGMKSLKSSISNKMLKRADELSKSTLNSEENKLRKTMHLSELNLKRSLKYASKYKK